RGFYRANVEYERKLDATKTRATVIYHVTLGARTTVEAFNINIIGFNAARVTPDLQIRPGAPFTLTALSEDIERIRQSIIAEGRLAPRVDAPQVQLNQERNTITVTLAGTVGPKVAVAFGSYNPGEKKARELLPVKREGTIDVSAIVEGARRLRNELQEDGYFFADVTAVCTVVPALTNNDVALLPVAAGTSAAGAGRRTDVVATSCENLNPDELSERAVTITYDVERGRRFKLTDIRIEGTEKLTAEDVEDNLSTKKANALGFIPVLSYGRGYTSNDALEKDRRTIEARMRDLGYRRAVAQVRQGVSLEGENLIITFVVNEGPLTRVAGVETRGNQLFTAETLRDATCPSIRAPDEFCTIIDGPFSRSQARADADRLRSFYSRNGYLDAEVDVDIVDLPATRGGDEQVRIIYTIKEADKIFINRIFINGLVRTERAAVMTAIPLREGAVLRAADLAETERILYATDAFRQVIVRPEDAGENASGYKRRDIIIDVEERQSYDMQYGGGYSTDNGPLGLFEIRNNNLFGKLRQGALRSRASRRQQLLRFEYFDPRFRSYNKFDFAPLAVSIQYQRDTSVTRFFRSTIDRGNFGIVQRLDEEGKPIDIDCVSGSSSFPNCERASDPSINRFTVNIETQRDFELELGPRGEVRKRSTLFLRYNYEDVRLFNINSLIIRDVLQPDRVVRLSRFAATFARDTRDRQLDATRGEFFTADYALALKNLGGNLSFSKLQTTYRRYYKINRVRETVLAGAVQFGLAKIYGARDRDDNGVIDNFDRTLPISERFFSGGSTTLRGFGFEEAGPRLAILPRGRFFDTQGKEVTLNPFLVPVGGNALAVVNLEARVTVRKNVQAVPFYDG
ncbi:MAG: BamA/TamA family outer membrane protein, partial [Pyrinomonadaceae bacterium]|nr:BamA/TamA family outer membrane protein [Pyrinomonadaceae bacterium]